MNIGDKVQHFTTGLVGTVIDSVYEVETPFQQMCVQWEDDSALYRDSWERSFDLSIVSAETNNFSITD